MFTIIEGWDINLDNVKKIRQYQQDKIDYIEIHYNDGSIDKIKSSHSYDFSSYSFIEASPGFEIVHVDGEGGIFSSPVVTFRCDHDEKSVERLIGISFDGLTNSDSDSAIKAPNGRLYGNGTWYESIEDFVKSKKLRGNLE
ncbi:MAG TPA: hypothetical protein PKE65_00235 [Rhizobiaceae bacterium]|nr:hypothetical protein [Rhizobiaceae bacterium]